MAAYPLAPALVDWAVQLLWLGPGRGVPPPARLSLPAEEPTEPSAADTERPPSEST